MIIVTQNREMILNLENLRQIYIHDGLIRTTDGDKTITLGAYESTDRAKKILGEIADKYGSYLKVDGGPMLTMEAYVQPMAFNPPKVYKMPEV